jgi:HK97 family phage major capsid protein
MEIRAVHKALGDAMQKLAHRKSAMAEGTGATGGYLVPREVCLRIDDGLKEIGIFHRLAQRFPMGSLQLGVPAFDLTAAHAAGDSPLFGGMGVRWTNEGQSLTELEPSFASSDLVAQSCDGLVYVNNQLVQDGGEPLGAYLMWQFLQCLEWAVEKECFVGVAPGRPQGIVKSSATAQVNRATPSHVTIADPGKMVSSLLPASFRRAIWACNPTVIADLTQLATFQQNSALGIHAEALCGVLLCRPVFVTEKLPALGTLGDLVLFDPKLYALGTREIEVVMAPFEPTAFAKNQTIYRLQWRGDGQPMPRNTIKLHDNTVTVGGFVALN